MQEDKRLPRKLLGLVVVVLVAAGASLTTAVPEVEGAAGDIGYVDQSFSGVSNPPTSDKPQSKLWYNDGRWWANMFEPVSKTWHIFRLDRSTQKWVDTGTRVDDRPQTLSDALWDGQKLYVASQWATVSSDSTVRTSVSGRPARLYRYSYNASSKTYTLDPGFPSNINDYSSESLTIDKDSTGRLWATWTQVSGSSTAGYTSKVYINSSQDGGSWGTPFVVPVTGSSVAPDDISGLVAFARNRIGVLWSNQRDDTMYWAVHNDGDALTTWRGGIAVRGQKQADDHLNLRSIQADQAGRVYAVVKTSLDALSGSSSSDPQIRLLVFKPGTGAWSTTTVGTIGECHTRPTLVIDEENDLLHVFATGPSSSGCPYSGAPGTIYQKVAPMDDPVFASGRGTPVLRDAVSAHMNNATSTKQGVTSGTGLVVLAGNTSTSRYWHADLAVGTAVTVPVASFTATPTSGTAPLTVDLHDTSSKNPTSWAWDFGNGTTSTEQNPSVTYDSAGIFTVTLLASNGAGTSEAATQTITVNADGSNGSIKRVATSTKVAGTVDTGLTIDAPAGTSNQDVLVSCLALNGGGIASASSRRARLVTTTGVSNPRVYGYYKVAGSSEPTNYRWTFTSSITAAGGIARYTGAAGIDGTVTTAAGASALSGTVPGVTTATDGAMLVGCMGVNSGATTLAITGPDGMAEAWDIGGKRHELDDAVQETAGPSGGRTWRFSSSREWAGWLAALRPR